MQPIVTRFPPSPTGFLHIGGARTALFNWLYSRNQKGKFVLRIEDTDQARSTEASVDAIFEAMEWLGIDWDDGPYFQTRRYDLYREYVDRLVASGHAYYCNCSAEAVQAMREKARAEGRNPKYDGTCRNKDLSPGPGMVVRIKAPSTGTTVVEDEIKGPTAFPNSELDDFIIQRSDGSPMYNLAVVVDDITMGINTVIRGDDHLVNTPKQILLYKALGASLPRFGHVPMVLGSDKTRLSKRHGAMSVTAYREMGYLPDALINYLVRLGWSHGDQEFFSREELIEKFSLAHIGKSPSMFDMDKLTALNAKHIQAADPRKLVPVLTPMLKETGGAHPEEDAVERAIQTLQSRSKTLKEMAQGAGFYFANTITYDEKAAKKFLKPTDLPPLEATLDFMEALDPFTEPSLEAEFKRVMETTGLKFGKIAQPVRVALTGTTVSPGIFEMILALGREKTIDRIRRAVAYIQASE